MKKLIALLFLLDSSLALGQGTNSPCYWAGTLAKCWPLTGIYLDDNRSLRLGEDSANGSNYVELISPASLSGNGVMTLPAATDTFVGKATTDTLTNKTIDADGTGNSITNIENADIKAAAAIERSKMADGTADHVVINSGAGAFSSEATLAMSRGGAGAALTAANGGLCYSDADSLALTAAGTASMWVLSGGAGAPTMTNTTTTAKVIDLTADSVGLIVQGAVGQTGELFTVENSGGTNQLSVTANGVFTVAGAGTFSGAVSTNALLVTTPTTAPSAWVNSEASVDGNDRILDMSFTGDDVATGGYYIGFYDSTAEIGSIKASSTSAVAFNTSSDARLKEDIRDLDGGLATVMAMKPRKYRWRGAGGTEDRGFIAQELKDVYPWVVDGDPDVPLTVRPMAVDYGKVTPVLAAAIQDLKHENDALRARIEALEAAQ